MDAPWRRRRRRPCPPTASHILLALSFTVAILASHVTAQDEHPTSARPEDAHRESAPPRQVPLPETAHAPEHEPLHLPDGDAYRDGAARDAREGGQGADPPRKEDSGVHGVDARAVEGHDEREGAKGDRDGAGQEGDGGARVVIVEETTHASWDGPVFVLFGVLPVWPWIIGLCCGVTGYSLCGLGMNLIRLSHIVTGTAGSTAGAAPPGGGPHLRETPFNRKASKSRATLFWLFGYFFNSLGGSLNVAGLRFAAQSLMAPLSSIALVANAFFATLVCGERLSLARDAGPFALIALGNTLTVASANHTGFKNISVDEFSRLFFRKTFQRYLALVVVAVCVFSLLRVRLRILIRRQGGREYASQTLVARMGLCHAAAGCILCVHSALFSKGSMLILAQGLNHALRPAFSLILSAWASLALLWVYTLNRLLKEYDALFIIPVIEVIWSLQSMISGGIFFDEFSSLPPPRLLRFALGVIVNVTGVLILSHRGEKKKIAE